MMNSVSFGLSLLILFLIQKDVIGQIDTSQCGKTSCCFLLPNGCVGSTCDVAISFQYNKTSGLLDSEVGTRNVWVAFGLNSVGGKMDNAKGEVCFKDSSTPRLKAFVNNGYSPDFSQSTAGLTITGNGINNNFVTCKYSRPISPPSGSYMVDLNTNWHIVAAFGDSLSGTNPGYHGQSALKTGFSSTKIDLKKPCLIKSASKSVDKVIAHGCLMIIAWVCFAASGMFIARYTKPLASEKSCFGEKVWFQSHRIFMTTALVLTIISFIIIFVHKEGWSDGAGAHPILGCIVTFLALLQPIMAAFRPHPGEDRRWIFNWAHRFVGSTALTIAAVTVILGLKLFGVSFVVIIIWIVVCVVLIIIMEIGLKVFEKSTAEYNPARANDNVQITADTKAVSFRQWMLLIAILIFFTLGFASVGIVAEKAV
ncbi:putative ferric-chelate reductase 1 [Rhopilema esculentum]|uniref:putative ferric-chelate reductase 1 n=1 Tax=Rhopilema esculentum TaxID=499914 RepID=UPI0031D1B394